MRAVYKLLILLIALHVVVGITHGEDAFGSKSNKLVSNKPRRREANNDQNDEDDVTATPNMPLLRHLATMENVMYCPLIFPDRL